MNSLGLKDSLDEVWPLAQLQDKGTAPLSDFDLLVLYTGLKWSEIVSIKQGHDPQDLEA